MSVHEAIFNNEGLEPATHPTDLSDINIFTLRFGARALLDKTAEPTAADLIAVDENGLWVSTDLAGRPEQVTATPDDGVTNDYVAWDSLPSNLRGVDDEHVRWQRLANCRGLDPKYFFIERGQSTRVAKTTCQTCPVRAECLEYAIARPERIGIWGGKSRRERVTIARQRRKNAKLLAPDVATSVLE